MRLSLLDEILLEQPSPIENAITIRQMRQINTVVSPDWGTVIDYANGESANTGSKIGTKVCFIIRGINVDIHIYTKGVLATTLASYP